MKNLQMIIKDFKRNKAGNIAMLLFMALAAGLVTAAAIVVVQLFASISSMYQTANPPHFLYMHKGEINQEEIDHFNKSYDGVTGWQTVQMINIFGEDLIVGGTKNFDLSDCILDISLVKQNKDYDFLLDNGRKIIQLEQGEIGIPILLRDTYNIQLGDEVLLTRNGIEKKFIVTKFVHDAQMNSTMCSSTRILISDQDFTELLGEAGEIEYIIETYFTDSAMAADYQTAYENAGLPQNGQAITYTILFLLSALTDIMMALVFILVSILLIMVALMCMKYTLMASLEEEIGEIGTMKAIGMSHKNIRNIYLTKIKILVVAGIFLGYFIACVLSGTITEHVSTTFGKSPVSLWNIGIPLLGCLLVYLLANIYCKKILKKIKKLTVVDALVTGHGFGRKERVKDGLYKNRKLSVNLSMSIRETFYNFRKFSIVFVVMCIVTGIIIIPINLVNTMESKEFISYMGSPVADMMIELETGVNIEKRYEIMKPFLEQEQNILDFQELRGVKLTTENADGEEMNLHIESGSRAGEGLHFTNGNAPLKENEIALSVLNAESTGKNVGDIIILNTDGQQLEFKISGFYQDVTGGGYSAKTVYNFNSIETESYSFIVNFKEGTDIKEKSVSWSKDLGGGYVIKAMDEFLNQTLGGVVKQVKIAVAAVIVIGFILTSLIVLMFMKLKLSQDVSQIAAIKAIGFTNTDVKKQYLYKIGVTAFTGILIGMLFSNILGSKLASLAFQSAGFGITKITFIINPLLVFIVIPVLLLVMVIRMVWISSGQINKYNIIALTNE